MTHHATYDHSARLGARRLASRLRWLLLLAAFLGFVACGGGGTGAPDETTDPGPGTTDPVNPPGGGGGGTPPPPARPLDDALAAFVEKEGDPVVLAQALFDAIDGTFDGAPDEATALEKLDRAMVGAIDTPEALRALDVRSRQLGGLVPPEDRPGAQKLRALRGLSTNKVTADPATGEGLVLIFVNGIGVDGTGFKLSLRRFKQQIAGLLPRAVATGMYNTSATDEEESFFGGLLCPAAADDLPFYREQIEAFCREQAGKWLIDMGQATEQWFAQYYSRFGSVSITGVGQSAQLAALVRDYVELGYAVVLVPHSQGNFFVRDAFQGLQHFDKGVLDQVAVVMTGSPQSRSGMADALGRADRVRVVKNEYDPVAWVGDPHGGEESTEAQFDRLDVNDNHGFRQTYLAAPALEVLEGHLRNLAGDLLGDEPPAPAPGDLPASFAIAVELRCGVGGGVGARITWQASARAEGYQVLLDGRPYGPALHAGAREFLGPSDLVASQPCDFRVRATNAHGDTDSASVALVVPAEICAAPAPFEILHADPDCDIEARLPLVRLAWEPAATATAYQVLRDGLPHSAILGATQLSFADPEVEEGKQYLYAVRASNANGGRTSSARLVYVPVAECKAPEPEVADLIVVDLHVDPRSGAPGDELSTRLTVQNVGDASSDACTAEIRLSTSGVRVTGSDPILATMTLPAIPAGGTYQITRDVVLPDFVPRTYYLWAIADADGAAGQLDRENDTASVAITLMDAEEIATRLRVVADPEEVEEGEPVSILLFLELDEAPHQGIGGKALDLYHQGVRLLGGTSDPEGKVSLSYVFVEAGTYPLLALFGGDATHELAKAEFEIVVRAPRRDTDLGLTLVPARIHAGEPSVAAVRLRGRGIFWHDLPDQAVTVYVDGEAVGTDDTDADGRATIALPALTAGEHAVEARFEGDATYRPDSVKATLVVDPPKPETLLIVKLDASVIHDAERGRLHAVLTTGGSSAEPLADRTVDMGIDGINVDVGRTDKDGAFTMQLPPLEAGTHAIELIFIGDDDHKASNARATLTVEVRTRLELFVPEGPLEAGSVLAIQATLLRQDPPLQPISPKRVDIGIDGLNVGGDATDDQGRVLVTHQLLQVGTIRVEAIFSGDDTHRKAEAFADLEVVKPKRASQLELELVPGRVDAGERALARMILRTADGSSEPLVGRDVDLLVDGNTVDGDRTDGAGMLSLSLPPLLGGDHAIEVRFAGDEEFLAAEDAATLRVRHRTRIRIETSAKEVEVGEQAAIRAWLERAEAPHQPVASRFLDVGVNATGIDGDHTDAGGRIEVDYRPETAGTHRIDVIFQGDDEYMDAKADAELLAKPGRIPTRIRVVPNPVLGRVGDPIQASAYLEEEAPPHAPVAGKRLAIGLDSGGGGAVSIDAGDTAATGAYTIKWIPDRVGAFAVEVIFQGDDTHLGTSCRVPVIIGKRDSRIRAEADDTTIDLYDSVRVRAWLEDGHGAHPGLPDRYLSVSLDGAGQGGDDTDAKGYYDFYVYASSPGSLRVRVAFAGDATHNDSHDDVTIQVREPKQDTRLGLDFSPNTAELGEPLRIEAKLEKAAGVHADISGRRVIVRVGSKVVIDDRTNGNGEVSDTWTPTSLASQTVRAEFGGDDAYNSSWTQDTLRVEDTEGPSKVVLRSPGDGSSTLDNTPTFRWYAASDHAGIDRYRIHMRRKSGLTWYDYDDFTLDSTSYTPSYPIHIGMYRWKVLAIDENGNTGSWSNEWDFEIEEEDTTPPPRVTLRSPSDGTVFSGGDQPTLRWYEAEDPSGVTWYDLEVQKQGSWWGYDDYIETTLNGTYEVFRYLPDDKYQWRVRAKDNAGNVGDWSAWRKFEIK